MSLKPYSEALFNTLEYLDNRPVNTKEGVTLDNIRAGIESYFIDQAVNDGCIIEIPLGSAKYKLTIDGVVLLNQIRLKRAVERFDKASKISSWVMIGLTFVMLILTGVIAWLTWILARGT